MVGDSALTVPNKLLCCRSNGLVGDGALLIIFANNLSYKWAMRTGQVDQSTIANPLRSQKAPASVENITTGKLGTRTGRNGMVGDSALTVPNELLCRRSNGMVVDGAILIIFANNLS